MNLKEQVGRYAARYIEDGMIVGLGTGSTAYYFVDEIGKRVKEGLKITGIPTSLATKKQAEALGIPLTTLDEIEKIDVTVDGADETTSDFLGIKGGGGALLFEKIVAANSKKVVWIVDHSKIVKHLGAFPLPVEVIKYGSKQVFEYFEQQNYKPQFRMKNNEKFVTDDGNYIIDLHLEKITDPKSLAKELDSLVGVVEHGLFLNYAQVILSATEKGIEVIENV